jgi:predicted heme/steroid binding protein
MNPKEKSSKLGLIVSLIVAFIIVAAAVSWAMNSSKQNSSTTQTVTSGTTNEEDENGSNKSVSQAELTAADGKDGNDCYLAVDGVVYEIKDSSLWQNGQHTPSNGQGFCGADMTKAIGQSPHGKSKLEQLKIVGRLE